jgi:hypothetical protein
MRLLRFIVNLWRGLAPGPAWLLSQYKSRKIKQSCANCRYLGYKDSRPHCKAPGRPPSLAPDGITYIIALDGLYKSVCSLWRLTHHE